MPLPSLDAHGTEKSMVLQHVNIIYIFNMASQVVALEIPGEK
jgi:hypothetical protein